MNTNEEYIKELSKLEFLSSHDFDVMMSKAVKKGILHNDVMFALLSPWMPNLKHVSLDIPSPIKLPDVVSTKLIFKDLSTDDYRTDGLFDVYNKILLKLKLDLAIKKS